MPKNYPWDRIRATYIEGAAVDPDGQPFHRNWPTMEEVATLYGISYGTVRSRARKEKWTEQREAFVVEVEQQRRQWMVEQRAERSIRVDDRGLQVAEAGMALVGIRLTRLVNAENDRLDADRGQALDARELAGLGLAARRFLDVKAHVMGQSLLAEEPLDALERRQVVEERKLADELARFIEERRAEELDDVEAPEGEPAS